MPLKCADTVMTDNIRRTTFFTLAQNKKIQALSMIHVCASYLKNIQGHDFFPSNSQTIKDFKGPWEPWQL